MYGARALGLRSIQRYRAKADGLRLPTSVTPNHKGELDDRVRPAPRA
jgi:hypothetical protein